MSSRPMSTNTDAMADDTQDDDGSDHREDWDESKSKGAQSKGKGERAQSGQKKNTKSSSNSRANPVKKKQEKKVSLRRSHRLISHIVFSTTLSCTSFFSPLFPFSFHPFHRLSQHMISQT